MTEGPFSPTSGRLSLKEPTGWFAAGDAFRKALVLLSDGAFRLFAYLCLQADRRSGSFRATHRELACALGKSKRVIGIYAAELQAKGVCLVQSGRNQFAGTIFEISDDYWPYHRTGGDLESPEQRGYIQSVRECFLALGCASGKFGSAETSAARDMHRRGIPLALVKDAMIMGACRKYVSWLEGRTPEPIRSLAYFEPLIAEIQERPLPAGYSDYLRRKIEQFAEVWNESAKSGKAHPGGGCPGMPSLEIVQ
jgi:hypothetical protein